MQCFVSYPGTYRKTPILLYVYFLLPHSKEARTLQSYIHKDFNRLTARKKRKWTTRGYGSHLARPLDAQACAKANAHLPDAGGRGKRG